jgi:hypothetical protein
MTAAGTVGDQGPDEALTETEFKKAVEGDDKDGLDTSAIWIFK